MSLSDRAVASLRGIGLQDPLLRDFVIEREAGVGGMGRVYEAVDPSGRRVALKVLSRESAVDRARFTIEAEALERIRHPGIVGYVAHGVTEDGNHYLAMEWLTGETLSERLQRGKLTILETVILGRRVAEALGAAHAAGLVHRDLKPSNLFLCEGRIDGVKIVDFGIAREIGAERELTRTGEVVGTPGYMAPEQARGRKNLDARTDLFSLGCVLFRCVTGKPVFEGEELLSILSKLILQDAPRIGALEGGVPKQFERLVARMLAKEVDDRPPSAEAVAAELRPMEEILARGEELPPVPASLPRGAASPRVVSRAEQSPAPAHPARGARRVMPIALGITAVAVVAGALTLRSARAPAPTTAPIGAPRALACSDAVAAQGQPTLEPGIAHAVGVGACARAGIALGIPWRDATGAPLRVVLKRESESWAVTLAVAGLEATGRDPAALDAASRAVGELGRATASWRAAAPSAEEIERWGAKDAAEARWVERAWRRSELGVPAWGDDERPPAVSSAFHELIRVRQSKAGTRARTEAIDRGVAALATLPEARRLAVEAHLAFYRDQSPSERAHALDLARAADRLDRRDPDVGSLAATLLLLTGNRDEGLARLDRLLEEQPTAALRALRLATSEPQDRDLPRSRRYIDAMVSILPETSASPAAIRQLVLERRIDRARAALAEATRLEGESTASAPIAVWLELAALEPDAARRLAARRLASAESGAAADAAFATVGAYLLEGRVAEAQSLELRQIEGLRASQPVLAAFHAYHELRVRRWLGMPAPPAARVDVLEAGAAEVTQLPPSRRVRLLAELALAPARSGVAGDKAPAAEKLAELEALCEKESLGDPVELQSALVGTLPLVRFVRGDRAAADRFAESARGEFEARRRVAADAGLAFEAAGDDARAAEAYELAMDPVDLESEAFAALLARVKAGALHRRAGRVERADALDAAARGLLAKADGGVAAALLKLR